MSKKMMKRTAALSALIAVALSGTVMAADTTYTDFVATADNKVIGVTADTAVTGANESMAGYTINVGDGIDLTLNEINRTKNITGNGNVTIETTNSDPALSDGANINVKNLTINANDNDYNGRNDRALSYVYGQVNINAEETISISTGDHAIHTEGSNAVVNITAADIVIESEQRPIMNSGGADVNITATNSVKFDSAGGIYNWAANQDGTITIKGKTVEMISPGSYVIQNGGNGDITVEATDSLIVNSTGSSNVAVNLLQYNNAGGQGDVILKSGGTTNVTGDVINAGVGTIDVSGKNTTVTGDVISDGKHGGTTNIGSTNNTTINGAISVEGPDLFNKGGDTVNISGKNITIDAGDDWAVAVRGGYGGFTNETAVNIGTADTENVTIKGDGIGLISQYENSNINVYGKKLDVEVSGDGAYGIYTGNNSECYDPTAEVNIYSDQTKVTMTGENSSAVVALSQSTLNIHGGLEASGAEAIAARGQSTINVNQAGTGVVKLDGDIMFHSQGTNPFVSANNTVNVNMTTEDSYLNGRIYVATSGSSTETSENVGTNGYTGMTLGLSNGATWNVTGDSFANTIDINDGNIVMAGTDKTIDVDTIQGDGGTVTTDSLTNQINIGTNNTQSMTVVGTKELTQEVEGTNMTLDEALDQLAGTVATTAGETAATELILAEGDVLGATTAQVGANGVTNINTAENTSNGGLVDMTTLSFIAWRGENDDLNERLGNLRNARENRGVWTRMSRAQQSYNSVSNQYSMYQVGYDQQAGDWTVGAAYSYTDGKSWFAGGTGENTHNVFSLYGTKMNDNGTFVDLVAKYGNLDYEYTLAGGVGGADYDTDAYSFSAEVGKRITSSNGVWVEPQIQLTYGTIDGVSYLSKNGVRVHQNSVDTFVARAGIMAGKPVYKGNVYLKASYLYDFDGEVNSTFTKGGQSADISRDLGGGWWEVGFGANFNLSDATHLYLDFEKAIAGEVDVEWKWNAGIRYSF